MSADSYLALSHMGSDLLTTDAQQGIKDVIRSSGQQQYFYRTREQVARLFEGTDLVEPGLVRVEEWHPDPGPSDASTSSLWCAVGRKH